MITNAPEEPVWLLETKLHPPVLRSDTLDRPRLRHTLGAAVRSSLLTLLCAPAGYGKSTLLSALPDLVPEYPVAWISLDEAENDPFRFLATLITVLQRIEPKIGTSAWPLLQEASGETGALLRRVVSALINDIARAQHSPVILVLDDLHRVSDSSVYLALTYLVENQPPQLRLVISTRHDPPLPLAHLAVRRQLTEIRRPDLIFTTDEMEGLFTQSFGLRLTPEELNALRARTEGWAVGLCMLGQSLERLAVPTEHAELLAEVKRTERYVFDFLADEVLRAQSPKLRRFLLQTSILSELTPATCLAVTGLADAPALLASLYRDNLFLTRVDESTYRYHGLFAEFLRQQLEQELPNELPELHQRAARAQSTPDRAVAHYLAAGLWTDAAAAIAEAGEHLLVYGLVETVRGWAKALPTEVIAQSPRLSYVLGGAAIKRGELLEARTLLRQAAAGFARAGDQVAEAITLSALASCHALLGEIGELRTIMASSPLDLLPEPVRARSHSVYYYVHMCDAQWESAADHLQEALRLTLRLNDPGTSLVLAYRLGALFVMLPGCFDVAEEFTHRLASVAAPESPMLLAATDLLVFMHLMRGRLDEAIAAGKRALAVQERLGGYGWLGQHAALYGATIQIARGDQAEVDMAFMQSRVARTFGQHQLWLYLAGRNAWCLGRHAFAEQMLSKMRTPAMAELLPVPVLQHRLAGLLALSAKRYTDAETELERAVALEEQAPIALAAGSARVLLARLHLERGRPEDALATLRPALAMAEELEAPGLILQEGHLIQPVLQVAATGGPGSFMAARVLELIGGSRTTAPAGVEPALLTPREVEVLRLMATGTTNRAIGQALYIGDETVKSHVTRILRKMDATTRTEAVARARELGLI